MEGRGDLPPRRKVCDVISHKEVKQKKGMRMPEPRLAELAKQIFRPGYMAQPRQC